MAAISVLAAATPSAKVDMLRLVADSGPMVKGVILILFVASILSWAVIIERYRTLRRAERDSVAFLSDLQRSKRLTELRDRADRYRSSPLVPVFQAGFHELTSAVSQSVGAHRGTPPALQEDRVRIMERLRRRLDESGGAEADQLDRHLGILATTGSVTPFIGLFGTVWGIINAFEGIGITGSANLAAVAPGISEALVATAAGLAAAIPAVIGYNLLLARARRLGGRIERFVLAFASIAESQIDAVRPVSTAVEAGPIRA